MKESSFWDRNDSNTLVQKLSSNNEFIKPVIELKKKINDIEEYYEMLEK